MDGWSPHGDWKLTRGDDVRLKVTGFPYGRGTESMWVQVISGGDDEGTGSVQNEPYGSTKYQDLIRYEGGSDLTKPHYVAHVQ